jgi:hypothetical protein
LPFGADNLVDQLGQHTKPDADAQGEQSLLRRAHQPAQRLLNARRQHELAACLVDSDLLARYGLHGGSSSVVCDLRERLLKLGSRLDALLERRERASRTHSFADARQSAGVTHDDADRMVKYAQDGGGRRRDNRHSARDQVG